MAGPVHRLVNPVDRQQRHEIRHQGADRSHPQPALRHCACLDNHVVGRDEGGVLASSRFHSRAPSMLRLAGIQQRDERRRIDEYRHD